jgi:flagellar FliL protein
MANATAAAPAAPAAEKPAEGEKPAGSKKKLILIIAAAVLLVGGGAGFFLLRGHGDAAEGGKDKKAAAEKKAEHKLPAQYIALDPPFVVNFDSGAAARFLQVTVQLMTREPEMVEWLKQHDPVIRNDLLLLLGGAKYEEVQTREGKEALRQAALEAVRAIIKSEGAEPHKLEAVYFTSFVMQ